MCVARGPLREGGGFCLRWLREHLVDDELTDHVRPPLGGAPVDTRAIPLGWVVCRQCRVKQEPVVRLQPGQWAGLHPVFVAVGVAVAAAVARKLRVEVDPSVRERRVRVERHLIEQPQLPVGGDGVVGRLPLGDRDVQKRAVRMDRPPEPWECRVGGDVDGKCLHGSTPRGTDNCLSAFPCADYPDSDSRVTNSRYCLLHTPNSSTVHSTVGTSRACSAATGLVVAVPMAVSVSAGRSRARVTCGV